MFATQKHISCIWSMVIEIITVLCRNSSGMDSERFHRRRGIISLSFLKHVLFSPTSPNLQFHLGLPTPLLRDPRCCSWVWESISSPPCTGVSGPERKQKDPRLDFITCLLESLSEICTQSKNLSNSSLLSGPSFHPRQNYLNATLVAGSLLASKWLSPCLWVSLSKLWTSLWESSSLELKSVTLYILPISLCFSPWSYAEQLLADNPGDFWRHSSLLKLHCAKLSIPSFPLLRFPLNMCYLLNVTDRGQGFSQGLASGVCGLTEGVIGLSLSLLDPLDPPLGCNVQWHLYTLMLQHWQSSLCSPDLFHLVGFGALFDKNAFWILIFFLNVLATPSRLCEHLPSVFSSR